jgi:protein-disulfide isomerase
MSSQLKPMVSVIDNSQGNPDAILTLVEYGDYQCPHCGHAYPIVKQLQKDFGDKLRFVFRNFPLKNIHVFATPAAIAAEAAAKQNKFWEMHDVIFENQQDLHGNSFRLFAKNLGLDIVQFDNDCNDKDIIEKVEQDFESGIISGVNGTPTFFINGIRYNGRNEIEDLATALNDAINNI